MAMKQKSRQDKPVGGGKDNFDMHKLQPLKSKLTPEEKKAWEAIIAAGVVAQNLIQDGIAVGGTAASLYAGHRLSNDTDHLLMNLRDKFDEVLDKLGESPEWKTARLKRPVLILGSINGIEVGFRQSKRSVPIETVTVTTPYGDLVIPTLDEMLGMKAFLSYQRNTVRDFLDFAALSECTSKDEVLASLLKLDDRYGELQTHSVRLEVARALSNPKPVDFDEVDLSHYKALASEWRDWKRAEKICKRFGVALGEKIIGI
jgi:hypothetical protein